MILYIDDLLKEINILNYYKGEAAKRGDLNADVVQSDAGSQDAMMYLIRKAVGDIHSLNTGSAKIVCSFDDDCLRFDIAPINEDKRYMLDILKDAVRQYIVYEVRLLWMATVRPEWADASLRSELMGNIRISFNGLVKCEKVRRRATNLAGI